MGVFGLLYLRLKDYRPLDSKWRPVEEVAHNTWFIFLAQSIWYFAGANSIFSFLPVPITAVSFLAICILLGCLFGELWKKLTAQMSSKD